MARFSVRAVRSGARRVCFSSDERSWVDRESRARAVRRWCAVASKSTRAIA